MFARPGQQALGTPERTLKTVHSMHWPQHPNPDLAIHTGTGFWRSTQPGISLRNPRKVPSDTPHTAKSVPKNNSTSSSSKLDFDVDCRAGLACPGSATRNGQMESFAGRPSFTANETKCLAGAMLWISGCAQTQGAQKVVDSICHCHGSSPYISSWQVNGLLNTGKAGSRLLPSAWVLEKVGLKGQTLPKDALIYIWPLLAAAVGPMGQHNRGMPGQLLTGLPSPSDKQDTQQGKRAALRKVCPQCRGPNMRFMQQVSQPWPGLVQMP